MDQAALQHRWGQHLDMDLREFVDDGWPTERYRFTPYRVDLEDWFSEDLLPEARRHRPLRLLRSLERELLSRGAFASRPRMRSKRALWSTRRRATWAEAKRLLRRVLPIEDVESKRAIVILSSLVASCRFSSASA